MIMRLFPRVPQVQVGTAPALPMLLVMALSATPTAVVGQVACSELDEIGPLSAAITAAEELPPDPERGWPARCVASGAINGRIRFELHLPAAEVWNGKFLMGGGGGFGGVVANQALAPGLAGGDALQRGYATIGTDTGHRGRGPSPTLDASWAVDDWSALVDFGYRAVHETALLGRALTERYYGRAPGHSYFFGCSNGGRQGMMAAQRHPHLFDGIVAGAPGLAFPNMILHYVRVAGAMFPEGDPERPVLSADRLKELGEAVLAVCDDADGLEDGIVSDPLGCRFDPRTHLIGFSEAELRAVEAVYDALYIGGRPGVFHWHAQEGASFRSGRAAFDIASVGVLVGVAHDQTDAMRPAVWPSTAAHEFLSLEVPGANFVSGVARAINDGGTIFGWATTEDGNCVPLAWASRGADPTLLPLDTDTQMFHTACWLPRGNIMHGGMNNGGYMVGTVVAGSHDEERARWRRFLVGDHEWR